MKYIYGKTIYAFDRKIEILNDIYPGILFFYDEVAFVDNDDNPENRGYNIFNKNKINRYYELY